LGPKVKGPKNSVCQGQWQKKKTKPNNDHKICMHSGH